jgi:type IV pilus assembly protein PilN
MATINLLPWRDIKRQEQQRYFISFLVFIAISGMVLIYLVYVFFDEQFESQQVRNNYLTSQIKTLDIKIKEIASLEKERKELVDRMNVIQSLQKSRPQIVHLFDEIANKIPEGMNLKSIERKGHNVFFEGVAESSPRISNFIRNLSHSKWLKNPDIDDISEDKSSETKGASRKFFKLSVKIASQKVQNHGAKNE